VALLSQFTGVAEPDPVDEVEDEEEVRLGATEPVDEAEEDEEEELDGRFGATEVTDLEVGAEYLDGFAALFRGTT